MPKVAPLRFLALWGGVAALAASLLSRHGGEAPSALAAGATAADPTFRFLAQILVVLASCHALGAIAARVRQPQVVGHMVAGILLGPSLFGWAWPSAQAWLFPAAGLTALDALGKVGLYLFMFAVGLELDVASLKKDASGALWVSHVSMAAPFCLGLGLAWLLFPRYAGANAGFGAFALFMGVAMSITAFPVLARILEERRLTATPLGTLALGCAAADDATAWCILAGVVSFARQEAGFALLAGWAAAGAYVAAMLAAGRAWGETVLTGLRGAGESTRRAALVAVILFLIASAAVSEAIGLHALFGAFLAGAVLPPPLREELRLGDRVEALAGSFLLPFFFVMAGLKTRVGFLSDVGTAATAVAVIACAVAGKVGGSAWAARSVGQPWRTALRLGVLMNTRGLMELVVLNIGLELGVINPSLFTVMVLMAVFTTLMTGPLLDRLEDGRQGMPDDARLRAGGMRAASPRNTNPRV